MKDAWTWRARLYDFREASALRRGPAKVSLFSAMRGRTLFVATGTGTDFPCFPAGADVTAIDINDAMLRRADARRAVLARRIRLVRADAHVLPFADGSFDTVTTSCTLCSVPRPILALSELRRVLRDDGVLLMFEHVRSRQRLLAWTLDLMTLWSRRGGSEMNRDTLANAAIAGFRVTRIDSAYLDIILAVHARKAVPAPHAAPVHVQAEAPRPALARSPS